MSDTPLVPGTADRQQYRLPLAKAWSAAGGAIVLLGVGFIIDWNRDDFLGLNTRLLRVDPVLNPANSVAALVRFVSSAPQIVWDSGANWDVLLALTLGLGSCAVCVARPPSYRVKTVVAMATIVAAVATIVWLSAPALRLQNRLLARPTLNEAFDGPFQAQTREVFSQIYCAKTCDPPQATAAQAQLARRMMVVLILTGIIWSLAFAVRAVSLSADGLDVTRPFVGAGAIVSGILAVILSASLFGRVLDSSDYPEGTAHCPPVSAGAPPDEIPGFLLKKSEDELLVYDDINYSIRFVYECPFEIKGLKDVLAQHIRNSNR